MKLVVLEASAVGDDVSWEPLSQFGELTLCRNLEQEQVRDVIMDADVIFPNKLRIDRSVLEGTKVKAVFEAATGYNNIDVEYCHSVGISVANVSGYSTNSVVQHTFAILLSLYESIGYYDDFVKNGSYSGIRSFCHFGRSFNELYGKTWGIVGMGSIGRRVAAVAEALGCHVTYYSASGGTYDVPYEKREFDQFLAECDVISLHCPLNEYTHHLFDESAFRKMKSTAFLVNVARGPVVCEEDLARALNAGELAGAALDVFEEEPLPATSPLFSVTDKSKLLLTPHNAWGSIESRSSLVEEVCENVRCYLKGIPRNLV